MILKCACARGQEAYCAAFTRAGCLLAASTQSQHQVQGRLLLDVVVGEGAAVLELLAGEDQALLVGGDALLVLR